MAKKKKEVDDRFKRFGTVSFTGITKVNDFVGYLEQGKLMGTRCKGCGKSFFPPRADCFQCLDSDMEWFEVSGTGKLVTYSQLQYAPVGFEGDLPYCIALLDYGDYKVFGRIAKDIPEDEIKVGMEMRAEVVKLPNGQLSYEFRKA
ncbi:MAG: Zn-ribbon domain-containing OB-fold protein [Deltaproteobacteria bacterium]|nr:Zn-ribbon domain-containing OB-fold protein [Deltaproteobacteria bacterium]MBW1927698.1 Zn-ribbon domain-containing OB-fold protein [Deltaproteobacteria bacterium]MBW2025119.1 Zn-ribbon domain-containing OB-fold protein [Deltaproteobacteria bacterium]MBW2125828.1 Zn-ribbon domain-containing OB-fold protein [Deltaproteobacteria bacterium]RLB22612.1 MAG: DNA-binding protein [Deltaproteobacteria bacterium]